MGTLTWEEQFEKWHHRLRFTSRDDLKLEVDAVLNNNLATHSVYGPIGSWDVGNVTDMAFMFSEASHFDQDLRDWNVSNVTNMEGMFHRASSFDQVIGDWNVSNVTYMRGMFQGASSFNKAFGDHIFSIKPSAHGM